MASTDATSQPPSAWDEAQCKAALAQLERMQTQLADLRLTIHRVVQPLSAPLTDNPLLFNAYKQATIGSQNNIKAFRAQWQSPEIQSILDHTKESFAANSDLSAGAQLPRYGWSQSEKIEKKRKSSTEGGRKKSIDVNIAMGKEEIGKAIEEFRKANPQIKVWMKDENRNLMIEFMSGSLKLKFHIAIDPEANSHDKLKVECLGTMKPFTTITKNVASRPKANDFKYLLDMIAAYKLVQGLICVKCGGMLDYEAQIPTARRSKIVTKDDGTTETVWEALHDCCLD